MAFIETLITDIISTMKNLAPGISVLLIISGALILGFAYTQPSEKRGKWQEWGVGLLLGGVISAAIIGAAEIIQSTSSQLLT